MSGNLYFQKEAQGLSSGDDDAKTSAAQFPSGEYYLLELVMGPLAMVLTPEV